MHYQMVSNKTLAPRFRAIYVKTFVCIYVGVFCVLVACRGCTKCQLWSLDGCKQGSSNWALRFYCFCQKYCSIETGKKKRVFFVLLVMQTLILPKA